MDLFSDDKFDWHLRSQIVLLLNHEQSNPQIEFSALHRFWSGRTNGDIANFKKGLPIAGFMTPGVDGDFAQIVIFDKQAGTRFCESFAEICDRYHIPFSEVDEAAFETTSWILHS